MRNWDYDPNFSKLMDASEFTARCLGGKRDFSGIELRGADLRNTYLIDIDLRDSDLRGADLRFSTLIKVDLVNSDLTNANLTYTQIHSCNLEDAFLIKATLSYAWLLNTSLRGANLSGASLGGARIHGVDLSKVNLSRAEIIFNNLSRINLSQSNLENVDLTGTDLSGADLTCANLESACLIKSQLIGAELKRAMLSRANLAQAKLNRANLTEANLTNAILVGADLTGANLSRARLDGTILAYQKQLKELRQENQELTQRVKLLESQLTLETQLAQPSMEVSNQGIGARLNWQGLRFRSGDEIRIAEALDRAGVLFYPNCKARLNASECRDNKESDFLVLHEGKWGILEVDGRVWHQTAADDHERDRLFKTHGIRVVERYSAERCGKQSDQVVQEFLTILSRS